MTIDPGILKILKQIDRHLAKEFGIRELPLLKRDEQGRLVKDEAKRENH